MVTYHVSSDCIAAFLDASETVNIRMAVSSCLAAAGCRPWQDMEAELYDMDGRCLLIARPRPPARERLIGNFPRLNRS